MLRKRRGDRAEGAVDDAEEDKPPAVAPAQRPRRSAVSVLWPQFVRPFYGLLVAAWLLRLTSRRALQRHRCHRRHEIRHCTCSERGDVGRSPLTPATPTD